MKTGRNDPCHCGSGKKYKHCCYEKDSVKHEEPVIEAEAAEPEADEDDDSGKKKPLHHKNDRPSFRGDTGGKTPIRPRATRGAQRGS